LPYVTYGGTHENINLATGDVNIQIPLLSLPGRNKLDLNIGITYDSKFWVLNYNVDTIGDLTYFWQNQPGTPYLDNSWRFNLPVLQTTQQDFGARTGFSDTGCWSNFVVTMPDGAKHMFRNRAGCWGYNTTGTYSFPSYNSPLWDAQDTSLLRLDTTNPADVILHLKDGTQIHFFSNLAYPGGIDNKIADKIEDTDGNQITIVSTNPGDPTPPRVTTITDTLGRVVTFNYPATPANVWAPTNISYLDSAGTTRYISFGYTAPSCSPTFSLPAGSVQGGNCNSLTSVTLPNNLHYNFTYNTTLGELSKITYPTGGYTRYDYATYTNLQQFNTPQDATATTAADFREISARHECRSSTGSCATEDTTTYTPTIDSNKPNNLYMDVIDASNNLNHYQFSQANASIGSGPHQTDELHYSGPTASPSALLRTIHMDYNAPSTGDDILAIRVTTTLNDTNLVTKVESDYDTYASQPIDNVIEQREFAYGSGAPGALIRKTDFTYLKVNAVNGADYTTTAIHILNRKASEQVYDGASNLIAQSQFEYDRYDTSANHATLQSSGAVQHDSTFSTSYTTRGNVTAAQHWRNTDGAWLSAYSQFDDAGNPLKAIDFGGHTTTFSFADSWSNSSCAPTSAKAYPTTVTNALSQSASSVYNSCSGTVASTMDANSQIVSNSYDLMGRLTQTNLPDSGLVTRTFNESSLPLSLTPSIKITSAANLTPPVVVDGLGRVTQSQLTSDPEGTTFVDTTFDEQGRKKTVSNPYRTGDTIYLTTYNYDPLGRVIQVIPQDGTASSNNVTTTYSGNCTTVTDQVGNARKTCSDSLGHLIEVDEPTGGALGTPSSGSSTTSGNEQSIAGSAATSGAGSSSVSGSEQSIAAVPATSGSGSSSVSGSEQSIAGTSASSGSGSVTIGGAEQPYVCDPLGPPLPRCNKLYDAGTVTIVVNGFTAQTTYGQTSTLSGIVSALNTALNASGSPVNSSISGSTLQLTAKTTGTATNYSLSASSSNNDPSNFPSVSFTASASGATLTGGHNATSTVYDSGSAWVTVNGTQYSVSYGQSSTSSTVASALASAMSAGSLVNATASGAGITITAKTTGASTNYSLSSGSSTGQPGSFSSPSFSVAVSGGNMTGGTNGSPAIYDSGSAWVTVNGTQYSVSYGQSSTSATVASALASAMSAGSLVNATASGAGITITAKTTGNATNYSLSSGSSTGQPGSFASPSFSVSVSGANLTGGHDAGPTTYDSGNVWVTLNGTQYSVSYGQNSTSATIASTLASALNASSSPVSASTSGSVINLLAKSSGAATNYSLSGGSSTSLPGSFGSPSFSVSVSGASMTGGTNSSPGSLSTPAVTLYTYDTLGNLVCAVQKGTDTTAFTTCAAASTAWRPRSFVYNSLSQLLTSTNPESGTITYSYDADGNVLTKMDARSVTTTYFYDVLHRLTKKTYSDFTPQVIYGYDGITPTGCTPPALTITNGVGRRTAMCDAAGSEAWNYDQMGRVLFEKRTTNAITKTTSYTYNFDGSLATITYPSGRVITYAPSAAGRTLSAIDSANSINYATAALYSPMGALSSLQNGSGIVSTFYYNPRLQPCRISVKTSGTAPTQCSDTAHTGNLMDLNYGYNVGVADNGSVAQIINNLNAGRTQTFTYDSLNRISSALTQGTSGSLCWGLDYGYDVYANLRTVSLDSARPSCSWTILNAGVDSNNRITNTGFSYDAAGNVLSDASFNYTWDAESELKTAAGVTYTYDGDGRRAQKSSGKLYWYGATGDILDESDASGNITDEFVFFGGKRIARRNISSGNIYYYLADHLGTARMIVQAGQTSACYDADFDPFGGEHIITNTCPQNYKFNGKERDPESNLDDFEARYYSSQFGRFHSADWSAIPAPVPYADLGNPQTLNLYAYVKNNPLNLTDPTGHQAVGALVGTGGNYMAARMRAGESVLGCAYDGSCGGSGVFTEWEITVNGEGTGIYFDNEAGALLYAAVAQSNAIAAQQATLKGPYVADLKSPEIAPLLDPNHKPSSSDVVGPNAECVDLTKKFSGMGDVSAGHHWYQGEKVSDAKDIKPGTAIANFNDKGRFPNKHQWNSGIYLGPGVNGSIWILDQWPGNSPRPRELLRDSRRAPADNAGAYSVILTGPWR
jgi:RHS repeat-associated protein